MPLSKERMRERKKQDRARIRFDKQLAKPQLVMRLREPKVKPNRCCEVCGYSETVDIHHEGGLREEHTLCPNHHSLITRGIKTMGQLLSVAGANPVIPNMVDKSLGPQPVIDATSPSVRRDGYGKASSTVQPKISYIDADGYLVYDD